RRACTTPLAPGPRRFPYTTLFRSPCLALLRVGFAEPDRLPGPLVGSYSTLSPLPVPERHRRSALCCTFRRVTPPGSYPAPCPVESGLSSVFRPRPSSELAM